MIDIKSLNLTELAQVLTAAGFPRYRAQQLYRWMHVQLAGSPEEMTNLPKELRRFLAEDCSFTRLRVLERRTSRLDGTQKFLFGLPDGETAESVLMRYHYGVSVCVSSQVGCRMGCSFCASTIGGLVRGLTPGEILEEIYEIRRITGERVSHVVVMGTGEPLDNYDHVVRFLRLLTDENGQNLSARNVTVSTCGIVPRIDDLSGEGIPVTLALSLHAATDEKRRRIMPIANRYTIEESAAACRRYSAATGRRVTFEYSLIRGVNDSKEDAELLAGIARRAAAHVNLIPVNPVKETGYAQPEAEAVRAFGSLLEKRGINVSIRRVLGRDIDGACGQLRRRYAQTPDGSGAPGKTPAPAPGGAESGGPVSSF